MSTPPEGFVENENAEEICGVCHEPLCAACGGCPMLDCPGNAPTTENRLEQDQAQLRVGLRFYLAGNWPAFPAIVRALRIQAPSVESVRQEVLQKLKLREMGRL